tara:strand:+ start:432 stop:635 length:204 start_codon:yes stop_codon:yes gene_type:complete
MIEKKLFNQNKNKAKSNKKRANKIIIPISTSQKSKNNIYDILKTDECKKLIKKDKKINVENIFVKKK